jgi:hypothetical protein
MSLCKDLPRLEALRSGLYLLLLLAAVWQLAGNGWGRVAFSRTADAGAGACCQLDSFSQPAIASALLKEEAERLRSACGECWDRERQAAGRRREPHRSTGDGIDAIAVYNGENPSRRHVSLIQSMEQLRREVKELKTDLNRKLLGVYSESGLWAGFLDRYLEFLQETPENRYVVDWAPCALVHAQECGRTTEVEEALEHAARISSNANITRGLRTALAERGHKESPALGVPNP